MSEDRENDWALATQFNSLSCSSPVYRVSQPQSDDSCICVWIYMAFDLRSNTRKFDPGLSNMIHIDLHWLDVPERVTYKLSVMVYHCMHGTAQSIYVIYVH